MLRRKYCPKYLNIYLAISVVFVIWTYSKYCSYWWSVYSQQHIRPHILDFVLLIEGISANIELQVYNVTSSLVNNIVTD
jgi:uncharacterized membrane protein SirB2